MASALLDVCRFNPTLGGTTDWTYSTAVTGYQGPVAASAINGATYSYRAESNDLSQWEVGFGAYNSGTGVFARTTVLFNSSGTTAKINFTTVPQVAIVALAEDLRKGPKITVLTSGTAATFTTDTATAWMRLRMVGGGSGGGGGGTGSGGSSAATASTWSGGTLSAGGGAAVAAGGTTTPVNGGASSGGNIANIAGAQGSAANNVGGTNSPEGGNSFFGGAGGGALNTATGGAAATNSGSGGGAGPSSIANTGADSGAAGGYVEHIISGPAATYTYTVGAKSTGGTAGTSGGAGGNGSDGIIIVEEYFGS